jgi:eukaryotic translation initiation factor 2C
MQLQMKDPEEHQVKSRPLQKLTEQRRWSKKRRSQIKTEKSQEAGHDSKLVPYPTCKKSLVFSSRPGYGQLGTKCIIKANHFLVDISISDLSHYNVSLI